LRNVRHIVNKWKDVLSKGLIMLRDLVEKILIFLKLRNWKCSIQENRNMKTMKNSKNNKMNQTKYTLHLFINKMLLQKNKESLKEKNNILHRLKTKQIINSNK